MFFSNCSFKIEYSTLIFSKDEVSEIFSFLISKMEILSRSSPTDISIRIFGDLFVNFVKFVKPKAIIFSGGDDPKKKDLRRDIEIKVISYFR